MIDLGDQVTLTYPSKTASPASVTVTIGLPDGTTTGPVSATSGTYTYTTAQAGRHTVLWVATGPSDSYTDVFDVADVTSSLVSLDDARKMLNLNRSTDDEELRFWIRVTTALVEHEVGPVTPSTHSEIVDAAETIVLAKAPVLTLVSVVPTFPYFGLPLTIPQYVLDGPSGILRMQPWTFDVGFAIEPFHGIGGTRLTVTYTTGRPIIPANVQAAALVGLKHLWKEQRLAGPLQGSQSDDPEQLADRVEMPPKFYALLRPDHRSGRIA